MSNPIPRIIFICLAAATLVAAIVGIWTGDERWFRTAGAIGVPSIAMGCFLPLWWDGKF